MHKYVAHPMVSGRTWHDHHLYMPVFMRNLIEYRAKKETPVPTAVAT